MTDGRSQTLPWFPERVTHKSSCESSYSLPHPAPGRRWPCKERLSALLEPVLCCPIVTSRLHHQGACVHTTHRANQMLKENGEPCKAARL